MGFSQLRAASPTGTCRPFDKRADGLVVGEGAGIFVLRRLEDAVKDGSKIYAVIRGIGLSNDVGGSLLAPDSEGQLRAMNDAYRQAGWSPGDVGLIECHGTGTPTGDRIELQSLKQLWNGIDAPADTCIIGSVKSNVGHLLTAAGAAGLMKLVFSLKNKILPPQANFMVPDPALETGPFSVLTQPEKWERKGEKPLRCALSAFGFGGINGHLLLEEFIPPAHAASPEVGDSSQTSPEPVAIAIVGIATSPGGASSRSEFCRQAASPSDSGVSDSRFPFKLVGLPFDSARFIQPLEIPVGKYRISPAELQETLPQQLLMLETAYNSINDCKGRQKDRLGWGVFTGISLDLNSTNFSLRWGFDPDSPDSLNGISIPPLNSSRTVGALGGIVASRIAREFNAGGPSHTFSSDENSGIVALEAGARALQRNEISTALVGAVDLV